MLLIDHASLRRQSFAKYCHKPKVANYIEIMEMD